VALSPEDVGMLKEAGVVDEAAEARYRALQARANAKAAPRRTVRPARPRPVVQTEETRLRAMVDKAVQEALAQPEFGAAVDQLTESESSAAAPAPSAPGKPLHEMSEQEWSTQRAVFWAARQPAPYRPLTIGELTAGYDADQA